jgi:NADH:ubiquinone oxidoreductase subunit 6 (subunit J)
MIWDLFTMAALIVVGALTAAVYLTRRHRKHDQDG